MLLELLGNLVILYRRAAVYRGTVLQFHEIKCYLVARDHL